MMISAPWKARPIAVARLLERLEIEHLRHGGLHNGKLYVSYGQLQLAGLSRRVVKPALECGRDLGFIEIMQDQSGEAKGSVRPPNAYRLTYLPAGKAAPTDEWKRVTDVRATAIAERFRAATGSRSQENSAGELEEVAV